MTPLPSYTRPLNRDRFARRLILTVDGLTVIAAITAAALILAHAVLRTLAALPTLTDPAMVPGCC